tara:strand:- start:461 stop:673 length:213 start_codon:yes stop_codon:yes gene_type:complete
MLRTTEERMWDLFMSYHTLIGAKVSETGLDLYGTEQKVHMALGLLLSHQLEKVTEALNAQTSALTKLKKK